MNGWTATGLVLVSLLVFLWIAIWRTRKASRLVVGGRVLWRAFLQLLVIWLFSNLPIGMAVLFERYTSARSDFSWYDSLAKNLNAGEIFIYCAALVAPFVWTLSQYFQQQRRLAYWWIPAILACISTLFGAVVFAIARLQGAFNEELVVNTGIFLYAMSMVVWYWSIVADMQLAEPESPYKKERSAVNDMVNKLQSGGDQ